MTVASSTLLLILLVAAVVAVAVLAALWIRARSQVAHMRTVHARLTRELEQATEARETFFDLATHELRSPLSAILGYQELLEDGMYGSLDEQATDVVARLGRSSQHLLHLIDGVVELSRLRSGTVQPDIDSVNLSIVLASVADSFRTQAVERGLEPRVRVTPSLHTIRSDQDRLVRALDLLMTSAVKNPEGQWIGLDVTRDASGATVRLTGTRMVVLHQVDDLAFRLGLRVAVADGIARVLGGSLDLETDAEGTVHALSFRIRDLGQRPASDL